MPVELAEGEPHHASFRTSAANAGAAAALPLWERALSRELADEDEPVEPGEMAALGIAG